MRFPPNPRLRLHLVCTLFAVTGVWSVFALASRSAWGTAVLGIPIAVGLFLRKPLWRHLAIVYLWLQLALIIGLFVLYLHSGQRVVVLGPLGMPSPVAQAAVAFGILLYMTLTTLALRVLRQQSVEALFGSTAFPLEA